MQKNLIQKCESPFDVFDQLFGGSLRPSLFTTPDYSGGNAGWTPQVDVRETEEAFVIHAALPGVKKEVIGLQVKDGRLILSGEAKRDVQEEKDGWVRREISAGTFYRAFQLPTGLRSDKIEAKFEDGVLEVRVPKAEEAKPHSIDIR